MKDPASDFFLKQHPLEYYKCHLHAVLENEREGGDEGGKRRELSSTLVTEEKLLD